MLRELADESGARRCTDFGKYSGPSGNDEQFWRVVSGCLLAVGSVLAADWSVGSSKYIRVLPLLICAKNSLRLTVARCAVSSSAGNSDWTGRLRWPSL